MESTSSGKKKYKLRHGMNHFDGETRTFLKPGAVVELDDNAAHLFRDKFVAEHADLPPLPVDDSDFGGDEDEDDEDEDDDEAKANAEAEALASGETLDEIRERNRKAKEEKKADRKRRKDEKKNRK